MDEARERPRTARGPSTWNPVVPHGHPALTVRRVALTSVLLVVPLHLLALLPGLAVLRTVAGWATAAALTLFAATLVRAVASNRRGRRRRPR